MPITPEDKNNFTEHRRHLVESRRIAYEQFDKAVFLLSGGGLTISLTLIEKIIPFETALFRIFLIVAWSFFTFSILSTLYSFIVSQKSLDAEIQKVDDFLGNENYEALIPTNPFTSTTIILNKCAFFFFLIAVISLIFFVGINLS